MRAKGDRERVLFDLFRESIGQPSEPTDAHSHCEVLPLGIGRADVRRVGIAFDPLFVTAGAFGWAVAALGAFWRGAINLDELRIVNVRTESCLDGLKVGCDDHQKLAEPDWQAGSGGRL